VYLGALSVYVLRMRSVTHALTHDITQQGVISVVKMAMNNYYRPALKTCATCFLVILRPVLTWLLAYKNLVHQNHAAVIERSFLHRDQLKAVVT
jgi:hypothetical protein